MKGPPALVQHAPGSMMMDVVRGEHRDPAVAMLGVVPGEERSAEGDRDWWIQRTAKRKASARTSSTAFLNTSLAKSRKRLSRK